MSHLTITPVGTLARKTDDIKSLTPVMQHREMCLICSEKGRRGSCHLQCNFTQCFLEHLDYFQNDDLSQKCDKKYNKESCIKYPKPGAVVVVFIIYNAQFSR